MPRVSKQEKERNRRRIIDSASRSFRLNGVDGVGIDEIMRTAGMTHGAFYNHFESKDALAVEVCNDAFAVSHAQLARTVVDGSGDSESCLHRGIDRYLSPQHRDAPDGGCPFAALITDAARHGEDLQNAYRSGVDGYVNGVTAALLRDAAARGESVTADGVREHAIGILAEIAGALALSRAVLQTDPNFSDEILRVARDRLHTELRATRNPDG
jgi:TetR/AcrR family transcriptional repressor of nem operon